MKELYASRAIFTVDDLDAAINIYSSSSKLNAEFKAGAEIQIGISNLDEIVILLLKIGNSDWIYAPVNTYQSSKISRLHCKTLLLELNLIDGISSQQEEPRLFNLSKEFAASLFENCIQQNKKNIKPDEYYFYYLEQLLQKFTIEELAKDLKIYKI